MERVNSSVRWSNHLVRCYTPGYISAAIGYDVPHRFFRQKYTFFFVYYALTFLRAFRSLDRVFSSGVAAVCIETEDRCSLSLPPYHLFISVFPSERDSSALDSKTSRNKIQYESLCFAPTDGIRAQSSSALRAGGEIEFCEMWKFCLLRLPSSPCLSGVLFLSSLVLAHELQGLV